MKDIRVKTRRRLRFAQVIAILIVFFLGYRLVKIQLVEAEVYKRDALLQWTKAYDITSDRGLIYDRKGRKLAINTVAYTIWASPSDMEDPLLAAYMLRPILEIDEEELVKKMTSDSNVVRLKQWITSEEAEKIREFNIKGISIVDDSKRLYPFGNYAAYMLGFTDVDNNGVYGLERVYDRYLAGTPGIWVKATDAANRQLPYDGEKIYEPKPGLSLIISMDEIIQGFAEDAAQRALEANRAKSVSIIVMDPETGEIMAMANKPDYDPNNPREPLDPELAEQWKELDSVELQNQWFQMWRNYAINDLYEPGSTFKIVTAAAALEEQSATLNSHYFCNGFIRDIKGVVIRCSSWYDPHGDQDFETAFSNSCNPAFVGMARELGRDKLYEYIKAFGFGQVTGIDLPGEQKGLIPVNVNSIKEVNLATLSYGHNIAVTPIQMITAMAALGNEGKLMTPMLAKSLVDETGKVIEQFKPQMKRQVISKETADKILHMLEKTVLEGTGKKAYVPGYRVGGKTGTAQKSINGVYVDKKFISSFGGIAPVDDPRIAVLVIVDEPSDIYYGGTVAGPFAGQVIEQTLNYLEVPKVYSENELQAIHETVEIPDVVGMSVSEAGRAITEMGLKYTTEYEDFSLETTITEQYPSASTVITKGSIIDLYLEKGEHNPALSEEIP
ncbi:MAG: penicillin-binding transpeptidase domain-containing protein [Gudongella sp.]|nr:penicillin-binding transpeptidase domain-containing protein [Gudongella sp.]